MKIAKPILLVLTPIGVVGGVYEAFQLAGGLAFLMIAMLLLISTAIGMVVMTVRKEQAAEGEKMDGPRDGTDGAQ